MNIKGLEMSWTMTLQRVEEGLKIYCQDHKYITYSKKPNYDYWKEIGMALHCP